MKREVASLESDLQEEEQRREQILSDITETEKQLKEVKKSGGQSHEQYLENLKKK